MSNETFERYAGFIQEYIYRKQWAELRDVQVEACEAIMDTDSHVIIASGTASGKTEAAFFPMLTLLEKNPSSSIGIIYIGPLKALINDQFERLNELLAERDIPVYPWHGDVSRSVKKKAFQKARGIVQITPESLESLLMRHPGEVERLFGDLRFVVIDEIHALMGEDRGLQVLCLIDKLEKMAGCRPRRIGLSATLKDYEPAMEFLSAGSNKKAVAVGLKGGNRALSLCAESFAVPADDTEAIEQYYNFLYDNSHKKKCLIFTNSRSNAEEIILNMKEIAKVRKEEDVFYVHHGSISAAFRHEAESALREKEGPTVAAATLTLELGIDIGDLDSTIQIGAPYSCSSFVQRLGRSGRRSGKSKMMFLNLYEEGKVDSFETLPWDLLRTIAIVQLYLEDRWVEPFTQKQKPFSLLAHQTLSNLMNFGELTPPELARKTLLLPPFKGYITQDEYAELLRYMIEKDYLQKMEDGTLIPGLKGERIAGHYTFYSVFKDEETYKVLAKEGEIGTLTARPAVEGVFILSGRSWKVISIDEERKIIFAVPWETGKVQSWSGTPGHIHRKIIERIKRILEEDRVYPYLMDDAQKIIEEARNFAREGELLKTSLIPQGGNTFLLCPWTGTRELETIEKLLSCGLRQHLGVISVTNAGYFLYVKSHLSAREFRERLKTVKVDIDDPSLVLDDDKVQTIDKYDYMVPEELLKKAFLYNQMNVPAALEILGELS